MPAAPAPPTTLRTAPTAAGKAVAPSKAKAATVVPIAASKDIKIPGGAVSSVVDRQTQATVVRLTTDQPNGLKSLAGSTLPEFNEVLVNATVATIPNTSPDSSPKRVAFVAAALAAFKPTDELEGLLAAQGVALHLGAMECFRRAMLPDQHPDVASKLRKDGANLARGMTDMLEALDRKRGKGPQVVRVERVVVHEGGQAIVGNVQPAAPKAGVG
jgi:hypothetical protein